STGGNDDRTFHEFPPFRFVRGELADLPRDPPAFSLRGSLCSARSFEPARTAGGARQCLSLRCRIVIDSVRRWPCRSMPGDRIQRPGVARRADLPAGGAAFPLSSRTRCRERDVDAELRTSFTWGTLER